MKVAKLLLTTCLTASVISLPLPSVSAANDGAPSQTDASRALAKLFDDYVEAWLPLAPIAATSLGDHRYDDRFPDTLSEAKILELRARAQKALGDKFSLRDFHDEVLRDGAMPLAVLEEKIERWIALRKMT